MFSLKMTTRCLIGVLVGRGGDAALTGPTSPIIITGIKHAAIRTFRHLHKTAQANPKVARTSVPGSGVCAIRSVYDNGLAEDVTQETFLRLYKHMDSISDAEMLRPWLIRVAINLAKNTVRTHVRANTREENYVKESGGIEAASVETDYEEQASVSEIYRALNKIKEPLRSCLLLKQQGLSYKEIAGSLDLNEGSIGTFVARARAEFAKIYGSGR